MSGHRTWREVRESRQPAEATWDGKDFAAIQLLMHPFRSDGEPACRIPGGDMGKMQVRVAGRWVDIPVGAVVKGE